MYDNVQPVTKTASKHSVAFDAHINLMSN